MQSEDLNRPPYDFVEGATLLVDKPTDWTSFDVVNKIRFKIRYRLGIKKIKVGHAGTLDPLATGLLVICTGKNTKKLARFQGLEKEYTGTIALGATTPSYDLETPVDATFPTTHITPELIEKVRLSFLGEQDQVPPVFSAIKKDGKTLYKQARKGIQVTVEPRRITIHELELPNIHMPYLDFRVRCSKGTYIRSLAYDFGKALNSGGHLHSLCRTAIGPYRLEDAWNLEELVSHIENS